MTESDDYGSKWGRLPDYIPEPVDEVDDKPIEDSSRVVDESASGRVVDDDESEIDESKLTIVELDLIKRRDLQWMDVLHPGNRYSLLGKAYDTPAKYGPFRTAQDELHSEFLDQMQLMKMHLDMKRKEVAMLRQRVQGLLVKMDHLRCEVRGGSTKGSVAGDA